MTKFSSPMPAVLEVAPSAPLRDRRYHAGSLSYTFTTLAILFAWLLWGDFCFTLMETVTPSILPLKLKALGVPSWVLSLIMTTLPGALNMTICPWVSYRSDRYRSRWGRRIPFILWTMPFLCLSLILLGWSAEIAALLRSVFSPVRTVSPVTVTVLLIGFFMVAFQFFNMFVNSVYWYLLI